MNNKKFVIIGILSIILVVSSIVFYYQFIKKYNYMELRDDLTIDTLFGEKNIIDLNNPKEVEKADLVLKEYLDNHIDEKKDLIDSKPDMMTGATEPQRGRT